MSLKPAACDPISPDNMKTWRGREGGKGGWNYQGGDVKPDQLIVRSKGQQVGSTLLNERICDDDGGGAAKKLRV